jgi:Fe-S-cluster containining protein
VEKDTVFLSTREAIEAIIADFRQYDPQIILFCGIIPLITDQRIHLKRAPGKDGAWVNRPGKTAMKWLDGPELVEHMCGAIISTRWSPELLADVCSRVFQTRAVIDTDPGTGEAGIRLRTHMEDYACRQCGHCCRFLDYQNEVTAEDVAIWRAAGRNDILKWVTEIRGEGTALKFRAWVDPKTGKQADECPFLIRKSERGRWHCRIHDVKPAICRHYPMSRKHAVMSGCRGFEKK